MPAENSRCCYHYFSITEQHCFRTPVLPLTASELFGIQVLEITSLHLSLNRHLQHSFPFLSDSANTIQSSPIQSFTINEGLLTKLSKKPYSDYFEGIQLFSKQHLVPDFTLCFLFYPSISQINRGILFH